MEIVWSSVMTLLLLVRLIIYYTGSTLKDTITCSKLGLNIPANSVQSNILLFELSNYLYQLFIVYCLQLFNPFNTFNIWIVNVNVCYDETFFKKRKYLFIYCFLGIIGFVCPPLFLCYFHVFTSCYTRM